ncbi:MarR family winged helix-turn-helix transcriptional regulator [Chengkuizengella marina]|uniref:HTH-type transcriptional regulator SarZ n=1 Tax=Chengkuizengella marina TaxID=2507566 RepID=A0A6N9Q3W0_9BACL|nr:MarR family transcriptional regulator [Chengkuizengella marina]NBI29451.1 MarR family transcriptional regulator [Chengkuizengella marina]
MMDEPLKIENQLCFSIYALSKEFTKLYNLFLKDMNVTYPQYLVLLVLWEQNELTVKQLGENLLLDSGTLTPLLKRMEEADIVKRERSRDDERKVLVSLTNKGIDLKEKAEKIPVCLAEKIGLSPQEFQKKLDENRDLLSKILEAVES